MSRPATIRKYGKQSKKSKTERLFAELPQSPVGVRLPPTAEQDPIAKLTEQLTVLEIQDENELPQEVSGSNKRVDEPLVHSTPERMEQRKGESAIVVESKPDTEPPDEEEVGTEDNLRVLTWDDVCPPGDKIEKIAEASYAEVYRVTNEKGTSIIKVIRLQSPIKPQTKTQQRSGLVDEEPHSESDLQGELQISEWLADIPGFVVYKERYIVRGRACQGLLETHQAFHRRMKRKDPNRLQFYPSPSRYLEDTSFLVVELGDAGTALEDFELRESCQLWDIFFLIAIALARAEDLILFEHRDLHEGNLCIRKSSKPREPAANSYFGASGLDITILDYGLSRAEEIASDETTPPVAFDLEQELGIFTSTHASQCVVYRRMRSFLLKGDRTYLPPNLHHTRYEHGVDGYPISWDVYAPYTNVLWLAYIYSYLVAHFQGERTDLARFKRTTREMWTHLDPDAKADVPCFGSAGDVVRFAAEAGWITEDQLVDAGGSSLLEREDSIIVGYDEEASIGTPDQPLLRRSPRRRRHL
jgi:serine/threonine-protein kinase haspin